jgi:hypothetical protein
VEAPNVDAANQPVIETAVAATIEARATEVPTGTTTVPVLQPTLSTDATPSQTPSVRPTLTPKQTVGATATPLGELTVLRSAVSFSDLILDDPQWEKEIQQNLSIRSVVPKSRSYQFDISVLRPPNMENLKPEIKVEVYHNGQLGDTLSILCELPLERWRPS